MAINMSFAAAHLKDSRSVYEAAGTGSYERFHSTQPIYRAAVEAGLIKAQVPAPLGGTGGTLMDSAIVVEEMYAVETSASLSILGTGLGITPVILGGLPDMQRKLLAPFLSGEGTPLARHIFSESAGSGKYAEASGTGLMTVAVEDGNVFVLSGEKIWATNCGGWDNRGAELQCVCCRVKDSGADMRSQVAIIIVTSSDVANNDESAFVVLSHPQTLGHSAVNGPHVRYNKLRVPKSNLLVPPGRGADVIDATFTGSAALVGAMGVGIMRQTFEHALAWAKFERRGGGDLMLKKQSVAGLLVKIKATCEAARAMTWKAACALAHEPSSAAAELCYKAKIVGSEGAVQSVMDAINLVGTSAYSKAHPLANLLQDATVLPIFDGGNVGVRRRQIERVFASDDYDPWEATYGRPSTS